MNLFTNSLNQPQQTQAFQNIPIISIPNGINCATSQPWMNKSQMIPQLVNVNQGFIHAVPTYYIHNPYAAYSQQINVPQMSSAPNFMQNMNGQAMIIGSNYMTVDPKFSSMGLSNNNSPTICNPYVLNGFQMANMQAQPRIPNLIYGSDKGTDLSGTIGYSNMHMQNPISQIQNIQPFSQNLNADKKCSNINFSNNQNIPQASQGNMPHFTQGSPMNSYIIGTMPMMNNLSNLNPMQFLYNNSTSNEILFNNLTTQKTTHINNIHSNTNGNQIINYPTQIKHSVNEDKV